MLLSDCLWLFLPHELLFELSRKYMFYAITQAFYMPPSFDTVTGDNWNPMKTENNQV